MIYVTKGIPHTSIDLEQFISEKNFEICALKFQILSKSFIILCIYRSPSGDFTYFLNQLECILTTLFTQSTNIILCGDLNTNLLDNDSKSLLLQSLLASYNLFNTVFFPTRIGNNSSSLIDNIYIDTNRFTFTVCPLINGLSDHDGQLIHLTSIHYPNQKQPFIYRRKSDNIAIQKFADLLSYENWDDVFQGSDVNEIFNNFHNTYLRIFNISFPIKKIYDLRKTKPWITNEIKTLCANKRNLYITHRNSNDPNIKHYKNYCRTLSSTIEAAKKKYFNDKMIMSTNPSETTWSIIKTATNKRNAFDNATSVNINNKIITNPTNIADAFNPSAWSDGNCPHAARSHSFVYISTS